MVDSGKIKGVGLDVRSLDRGQSKDFFAHRILLSNNCFGLENVANIDKLPPRGAIVYVSPMKIKGGSGGPARIFAQTARSRWRVQCHKTIKKVTKKSRSVSRPF